MKKLLTILTSRLFVVSALILLQLGLLIFGIVLLQGYSVYCYLALVALSWVLVFYILSKRDNPMYKLAWFIPILAVPVFGGILYLIFRNRNVSPKLRMDVRDLIDRSQPYSVQDPEVLAMLEKDPAAARQSAYITRNAHYPVFRNTETVYLSPGEKKLEALCAELKKAKKFIFLEYFIVEEGEMWDSVLEILTEKARCGVDVRLIYDDMGCIQTLPPHYDRRLAELGIQTRVFNPFRPALDLFMNDRDHRKICVIDGVVGFTGGINLADEYINVKRLHGHWKDASILLRGEGVWNLTVMFLQLWEALSGRNEAYDRCRPEERFYADDGFVQPFADNPVDEELTGECVYRGLIQSAVRTIHIQTPYLILDHEMMTTLCLAAKSGVRVQIVTPHIPDKWYVHEVTRANYPQLLEAGVEIYEYTPGFIHSKIAVADGKYAVIGTVNFDFRSFYLHYECGVWLCGAGAIGSMEEDFERILAQSQRISPEECRLPWYRAAVRSFLQLFSPLM